PYDVGPILLNLFRSFPGSLGRYARDSLDLQLREHMATKGGRLQRGLMPSPRPTVVMSDVVRDGEDLSDESWGALHCGLVVAVLALNWETSLPRGPDWESRLKDRKIGNGGSEITTPYKLTLEQAPDGLPPPGVAASIEAADLATGFVRDALLNPSLMLLLPALRRAAPTSARAWDCDSERRRIVEALHVRGMIGPIASSEIACRDGAPLLNGAFGVPVARDAPVKCSGGWLRPVLRPITNLIPTNARQECIVGDAPEMPTMRQLNGLVLAESEDLLWGGADSKAFFYVFRAPPPRRPHTVIGPPVPPRLLGLKGGGTTRICLRVIGTGWISAAGATTHLHRDMLRRSGSVPRGLSPSCEVTRRRRLPLGVEKPCPPAWMVYIDNLEIAEILDLHRAVRATALGELIDGVEGVRRPPAGYIIEMVSLAFVPWGRGRFSVDVVEDPLMCLALSALCAADMRLEVDHLATASASEAAGAVVYSTGFEILGLVPAVHLPFEVDAQAVRVSRRCYPGTQHLGDVTEADPAALAGLLRARGAAGPRASLVGHVIRVIQGPRVAMPETTVDFLGENAASMAESDALHLNGLFERIPLEVEAGDVGWVKRPRLYWASWDLLPSFEFKAIMVMAKSSAGRRACRVALQAERPPLEEWLPAGASCPGAAAGEPLPALVRWTPRSQPRPRPAGVGECADAELARWEEAGFAAPPYQFRNKRCIHEAGGRVAPLDAVAREKLMGLAEGRAAPCMTSAEAKASPTKHEALRRSLAGNSFQCEVVAWLLRHLAVGAGLLVSAPSVAELHSSARAWAGGRKLWAGDLASLRCGRVELDEQVSRELEAPAAGRAGPGTPA
ncbi:unnamed protein product, partial [Prorocentrum cordatum]